jgi:rubredoxin
VIAPHRTAQYAYIPADPTDIPTIPAKNPLHNDLMSYRKIPTCDLNKNFLQINERSPHVLPERIGLINPKLALNLVY